MLVAQTPSNASSQAGIVCGAVLEYVRDAQRLRGCFLFFFCELALLAKQS